MKGIVQRSVVILSLSLGLPLMAEPMTVVLKLKGKHTMQELAANVSNPASDHYQRFYEPAEIKALAGPNDAEYNDLLSGLKAEGMTVINESPTHLWVTVRGEKAIYESLFSTRIQTLAAGTHKPMSAMSVPFHLSLIESVSGLDSTRKSQPKYFRVRAGQNGADSGVPQATIKTAYGFDALYSAGLSGKNVDIAIATYDSFNLDNVNTFYAQSNITPAPFVEQVNFNGTAAVNDQSAGETELDSEFTGMIAPGSRIHVFTSATNDDAGETAMFTAILDDNRAKVVNYSWGGCEVGVTPQHLSDMTAVFARAVAQGVNIMVASGDSGSDCVGNGTAVADWPAASPYVVAVGGTTMSWNGTSLSETGWSGSGGGISSLWDLPAWQQALGTPYIKRSYPDVAFNADPNSGQAIYTSMSGAPGWVVIGGTSMAAPQWSGFMALVTEARTNAGKSSLGYLNPIIYAMSSSDWAADFNDVITGSNGAYSCAAGWDAVTGFGSMHADTFSKYLTGI